ncbi:hypothetical protein, partial [Robertmurraya andreesenii]|uniref:hypothetical protein n=1 Tax=Anoxybacillus andreesenii TaxID=1325932 RepID=UPI0027D868C2
FAVPALPISYTLPPQRYVRDLHPLERCAAKRTKERHIRPLFLLCEKCPPEKDKLTILSTDGTRYHF